MLARTLSSDSQVACWAGCSSRVLLVVGTRRALPSARAVLAPLLQSWGCQDGPGSAAAQVNSGAWMSEGERPGPLRPELAAAHLLLPPFLECLQTWLWDVGLPGAEVASRIHPPPRCGAGSWGVPSDPQQSAGHWDGGCPG